MLNDQRRSTSATSRRTRNNTQQHDHTHQHHQDQHDHDDDESPIIRDIHALTPPSSSDISSSLSITSSSSADAGENFTTISREFNALVLAGSRIRPDNQSGPSNLGRIGEEQNLQEETNPLAIVVDSNPLQSPRRDGGGSGVGGGGGGVGGVVVGGVNGTSHSTSGGEVTMQRVKKEEAESKISAWQNAKIAKINNRFKREEAVINGWEDTQVHKASSWMKEVERKLEEKRAKAVEKMQNDIAKAHRKAEERKASSEAKRGIKVARILEISNFMRAMGRPPSKRSFF